MRDDIQNQILASARKLFNERGYDHVAMREIAAANDIAVGNLTYHFHKKSDIATALMKDNFLDAMPNSPILTLSDVDDQFRRMLNSIEQNAFYFLDDQFIQESSSHNHLIRSRLLDGFETLAQKGIFLPSFDTDARIDVLDMLLMTHITWIKSCSRNIVKLCSRDELMRKHWVILSAFMTQEGKKEAEPLLSPI